MSKSLQTNRREAAFCRHYVIEISLMATVVNMTSKDCSYNLQLQL